MPKLKSKAPGDHSPPKMLIILTSKLNPVNNKRAIISPVKPIMTDNNPQIGPICVFNNLLKYEELIHSL